jgi:DivIVA domain-containing protein
MSDAAEQDGHVLTEATERPAHRFPKSRVSAVERARMIKDARGIRFPTAVRGYDRAAVDRYVEQVNRLIAELEISSSPEAAVRHALAEVGEETHDLLQRAHEAAEEITNRSRDRADERLEKAEQEAEELHATALREADEIRELARREVAELRAAGGREVSELRATAEREVSELRGVARRESEETVQVARARTEELSRSADMIWRERRRLLEDIRALGEQLTGLSDAEAKRFPELRVDGAVAQD